ncbi:MAG TPA: hypothetical protein VNJ07_04000 [Chitinophagales bacterium]|nr:hypothetical protein [Chitinophagales bacterium]
MAKTNFLQLLGLIPAQPDPFYALDEQLKEYLSEIITLRQIRQEQMQTISELRSENFRLKKELKRLKEER